MRTVTQPATNAITLTGSTKSTARLTAYKSRTFFETVTNFAPGFAPAVGSAAYPISEAVAYIPSIDKFVTVVIDDSDNIVLLQEGSATPEDPSIAVDPRSRPGIFGQNIFYFVDDDYTPGWQVSTFDDDLAITSSVEFSTLPAGAIYPVSADEAVIFNIDEGGIRPTFIASDGSEHAFPGRFMEPTHIIVDTDDADFYKLHYAGAVKKDGTIYVYTTTHYGSVKVIKYKLADNLIDGTWSDMFVAIPEDLSMFQVGNVFVSGTRIFICGAFTRREEYNTGYTDTLLCWSDDGITFSLDRRTLVTLISLRFQAVVCGNYIAYTSSNRYNKELAHYQVIGESCPNTNIIINNINGSAQGGWSVAAKANNELYVDDTNIQVGNFAKLEIGIGTTSGTEWIKYHDVVIASIGKGWRDGNRTFNMQIIPDGAWHISSMTHPFYMEVQGKQAKLDLMADMSNLYKMESGTGPNWALTCDFWTDETPSAGLKWYTHEGSESDDHWCKDITLFADEYPVFDDSVTIEVRIWGWSRAGIPSTNPNTPDSTPTNTLNDSFYALLMVEDLEGNQTTVVSLIGELTSTHEHPPQTHFEAAAREGSIPVVYEMANPGEGYKLIKTGVRVISDTGNTTYYLERMEFPDIAVTQPSSYTGKNLSENKTVNTTEPKVTIVDRSTMQVGNGSVNLNISGRENRMVIVFFNVETDVENWDEDPVITCSLPYVGTGGVDHSQLDCAYFSTLGLSGFSGYAKFEDCDEGEATIGFTGDTYDFHWIAFAINGVGNIGEIFIDKEILGPWEYYDIAEYESMHDLGPGSLELTLFPKWYLSTNNDTHIPVNCSITAQDESMLIASTDLSDYPLAGQTYGLNGVCKISSNHTDDYGYYHQNAFSLYMCANTSIEEEPLSEENAFYSMINRKKGVPQVFFSSRPYSAWNFDTTARVKYCGVYSIVGCFGLATDNKNYVVGYIRHGKYGIAQVKSGIWSILIEENNTLVSQNINFDIHFWHRNGLLGLEVKKATTQAFPAAGSQLLYEWTDTDNTMTKADDIFHVGLYEFIDPPRFKTTGYRSNQTMIPVLPLDIDPNESESDFLTDFPEAGTVDLDGQKYTYTGKIEFSTSEPFPIGPTQLRNFYSWVSPFNSDREGGFTYQGGMAIEFTDFRWLNGGSGNAAMYAGAIIASSAGYSWLNDQTQWKSWITTGGAVVLLKERSRHYSDTIPEYSASTNEKIYITNGLTGVKIKVVKGESQKDLTTNFPEGTFVFLDSSDEITVSSFYAASGEPDYSISSLLDKFCRIAGTKAVFRGDILKSNSDFSGTTLEIT